MLLSKKIDNEVLEKQLKNGEFSKNAQILFYEKVRKYRIKVIAENQNDKHAIFENGEYFHLKDFYDTTN